VSGGRIAGRRWTQAELDAQMAAKHGAVRKSPCNDAAANHQTFKDREARKAAAPAPVYALVGMFRAAGLPEPVPEYEFHHARKWRFDYALPLIKVAIEIEGGIWREGGGAHSHPLNIQRDIEKYNEAAVLGWRVLRVVPEQFEAAIVLVQRLMRE
jgi:hypothetical protein